MLIKLIWLSSARKRANADLPWFGPNLGMLIGQTGKLGLRMRRSSALQSKQVRVRIKKKESPDQRKKSDRDLALSSFNYIRTGAFSSAL